MLNADVGQVGSSAPPPAVPGDPPVQAPPVATESPRPIVININISITVSSPVPSPSATPAPTAVVPPALPVGTPAEPSTGPGDGFTTLMNPPESWRDIGLNSINLGTAVDYATWLAKLYVASGGPPVGEFDMRDTVWPTEPPAQSPTQGPSRPRTPPPSTPFFGPNPHHPKGVGGPWQH
jgi:hypothetical protein